MRYCRPLLGLAVAAVVVFAPTVDAGFGIIKTRVTLGRVRPPEAPLFAERVALDVVADPGVGGTAIDIARGRLERALSAWELYRLVDPREEPEATLRLVLRGVEGEVRSETEYESRYVQIGTRQEWNDKKKKMETKPVYGNRNEPVTVKVVEGRADALLEVTTKAGPFSRPVRADYRRRFKQYETLPAYAESRFTLRDYLTEEIAVRAIGVVAFAPDPVEALLATDDELKPGNRLAEAGLFKQALEEWNRRTFRGDKEAARLHNVGVGQEALAYELAPYAPDHRAALEKAKALYKQAFLMDPGEKYFAEPLKRIEVSLQQAVASTRIKADMDAARASRKSS